LKIFRKAKREQLSNGLFFFIENGAKGKIFLQSSCLQELPERLRAKVYQKRISRRRGNKIKKETAQKISEPFLFTRESYSVV
jgi:hypothetical protein